MDQNKAAKSIQCFYRRLVAYPKMNVDGKYVPIDPLYRTPFDESRRIKIFYKSGKYTYAHHFNIDTLVEWIKTSGEYINPITNLKFGMFEIGQLKKYAKKYGIYLSNKAEKKRRSQHEQKKKEHAEKILLKSIKHAQHQMMKAVIQNDSTNVRKIMLENCEHITNGKFNIASHYLSPMTIVTGEKIRNYTVFHVAAYNGNAEILETLCYFDNMIDIREKEYGYTPLHLACLAGKIEVAQLLIMYGAKHTMKCNPKFCCTNENEKMELDVVELGTISPCEKSLEFVSMLFTILS